MTKKKNDRQGTSQAVNERIISQALSEHVKVTDSCMKREREGRGMLLRVFPRPLPLPEAEGCREVPFHVCRGSADHQEHMV